MKRLLSKFTYANVISTVCLFLLLGGGAAFAAGKLAKNSVGSKQIKANAVTSAKIKNNAVTGAKIKNGAVGGSKINVGTLGTVPSATNATNAKTADTAKNVNGRTITNVLVPIAKGTTATVGSFGPFVFSAECTPSGSVENFGLAINAKDATVQITTDGNDGTFFEYANSEEKIFLDNHDAINNARGITTFALSQASGLTVTGTLGFEDSKTLGEQEICVVHGQVVS